MAPPRLRLSVQAAALRARLLRGHGRAPEQGPFHWNIEDKVGTIDAHASEVVRDERGRWYVSHCGWYQGGLYLAPLEWRDGQDEDDTSMPVPD